MREINVDARVTAGALQHEAAGRALGTDGCSEGIGMLALMPDGSAWCAHFICTLPGHDPAERAMIEKDAWSLLVDALGGPPQALQACSTAPDSGSNSGSNSAIWAGICQFFPGASIDRRSAGVYVSGQGTVSCLKSGERLVGQQATHNGYATIPMPVAP